MARRPRANRFDQLIDGWDPLLRKAFLDAVYQMRNDADVAEIARRLAARDVEGAIKAAGLDPTAFRPFDRAVAAAFEAGGQATARLVPALTDPEGFRLIFRFDVRNPAAERWLLERSSKQITQIVEDQRFAIRSFLMDNLAKGNNPRTAALDLVGRRSLTTGRREGGVIGLTSSQEEWVRNYEAELRSANPGAALSRNLRDKRFDGAVKRAVLSGEQIPDGSISSMVQQYKNRALRYRAETIARTEAMASLHEAQQQAIEQLRDTGAVAESAIGFIWRTAKDSRVRDSHQKMDGQRVALGENFVTGNGVELEFPGDPTGPPEEIINCFPPGTKIDAPDVRRAYRRLYEGDLVEVRTATGRTLTGTPNHPILSRRGWIGLGEVEKGDHLICRLSVEQSIVSDPNIDHVPTRIEDAFDALAIAGDPMRACGGPMDFHGDGMYRNVDIVSAARLLRLAENAARRKPPEKRLLKWTDEPALCTGLFSQFGFTSASAFSSAMRGRNLQHSARSAHSGPLEALSLTAPSHGYSVLDQNSPNSETPDAEALCGHALGVSGYIERDDAARNLSALSATFSDESGTVRAGERVVEITRLGYCGHVYNLETDRGWYVANGVFVQNCRCWREPDVDFLAGIE